MGFVFFRIRWHRTVADTGIELRHLRLGGRLCDSKAVAQRVAAKSGNRLFVWEYGLPHQYFQVGKVSGAHINPAVSFAFWCRGKMKTSAMLGYMLSQMAGAVAGCLPLLLWKQQGSSIHFGNTEPGNAGVLHALLGEVLTTAGLILVIFVFTGRERLRNYTPYTMPFLYSCMVWAEAPLSGCSTNPARSFGPAVITGIFTGYWIYWIGPLVGVLLILALFWLSRLHRHINIKAARVSYHDHPTPQSLKSD